MAFTDNPLEIIAHSSVKIKTDGLTGLQWAKLPGYHCMKGYVVGPVKEEKLLTSGGYYFFGKKISFDCGSYDQTDSGVIQVHLHNVPGYTMHTGHAAGASISFHENASTLAPELEYHSASIEEYLELLEAVPKVKRK